MNDETLKEQIETILDTCIFIALDAEMHSTATSVATNRILDMLGEDRERAVLTAQIGMIEYYDQVTNNKDMDWKGLFADNRKALEYDLSKLQSPNKREDSDE